MFYNRQAELAWLNEKFDSGDTELLIFWGRRRVGKTYLLREFCKQKNGIFLMSTTSSAQDNLKSFSQELAEYFDDERLQRTPIQNWEDLFLYLNEKINRRTVLVIDEYPYLVESWPAISSILQKYWDLYLRDNPHLMLIINGSAISMMERETLAYRAPLYGRRTGQWLLEGFDVVSANEFFKFKTLIEAVEAQTITGGIPYYCQLLGQFEDIRIAIKNKILCKGEVLFEELDFLLRQEFKSPRSYFPILKAIAQGNRKFGNISSQTGYDKSNLTKYLATLESLKLIRREVPITEKNPTKSRKGLYFLNDNFINFWFNFIFPNRAALESGEVESVMQRSVLPNFNYYVSRNVEPIIINLLKRDYFKIGLHFEKIGRYWDANTEIDIMGKTTKNQTVIGEIKWMDSSCSWKVYWELTKKVNVPTDSIFILVSKNGFEQELTKDKPENLILIDLEKYNL